MSDDRRNLVPAVYDQDALHTQTEQKAFDHQPRKTAQPEATLPFQ